MNTRLKINLSAVWLTAAALSLILPVFVPSVNDPYLLNTIGMAAAAMFVLSLPASLFTVAFMYLESVLGFDPNSIGVMYLNLWLFFAAGALQWFVIVPRLFRRDGNIQTLGLPQNASEILLCEAAPDQQTGFLDREFRTPLERIIRDDDSN